MKDSKKSALKTVDLKKLLEHFFTTPIFAVPNQKGISLGYGVKVAQQILILFV